MHSFNWMMIQATVAILILVGFESVTAMGGEAKNAKRDIPLAVIFSLLIQGLVCYLIEYFAANYFLNSGYSMQSAAGSAAPIGDMMIIVGDALLGQGHGKYFMLAEAVTVFLALIGTTLACMNTGARVTYAMGKDDEAPEHFGMLHAEDAHPAPRRAHALLHHGGSSVSSRSHVASETLSPHRCYHCGAAPRHLLQRGLSLARQTG
jgi:APA family basic amino acid/polyamine antiporter